MSYDSDDVYVTSNDFNSLNINNLSLNVTEIDNTHSPYTVTNDVVILADTSSGSITINLAVNTRFPNTKIITKNVGAGVVTIMPPSGETVNGGASTVINTLNDVVRVIRNDNVSPADWVITSTAGGGGGGGTPLTTKGDILTHTGGSEVALGVGANGTVLVADSTQTNGIKWGTVSGTNALVTYSILNLKAVATNITWDTVAYFTWDESRYGSSYTSGVFIFWATINGLRLLDVRVRDVTNGTTLGSISGVAVTGAQIITPLANPASGDVLIEVQIQRTVATGMSPNISGGTIEYIAV